MTAPDLNGIATVAEISPRDAMMRFTIATPGSTNPGVSVPMRAAIFSWHQHENDVDDRYLRVLNRSNAVSRWMSGSASSRL